MELLFAQAAPVRVEPVSFGALQIVSLLIGLGSLVCFVLVVIQMFQHGQTGLAIASIVLIFCCGIGGLVAFVVGWMNANAWGIKNTMLIWTALIVVNIILSFMAPIPVASMYGAP
jgi:hypothetical protein